MEEKGENTNAQIYVNKGGMCVIITKLWYVESVLSQCRWLAKFPQLKN